MGVGARVGADTKKSNGDAKHGYKEVKVSGQNRMSRP